VQEQGVRPQEGHERRFFQSRRLFPTPLWIMRYPTPDVMAKSIAMWGSS
jgi:hypothetical protein